MLVGHLLCGIILGALVAVASLVFGLSLLQALLTIIIATNVGLAVSVLGQSLVVRPARHERPVEL